MTSSSSDIKVLVVDDSAMIRKLLTDIINAAEGLEVVGAAIDPLQAREMIKALQPDVLTLDVEMPRMDGLTFLRNLMRLRPMPVVMVSSLTEQGAQVTMDALEIGAIDFVTKPKMGVRDGVALLADEIVDKIRSAAQASRFWLAQKQQALQNVAPHAEKVPVAQIGSNYRTTDKVIGIGSSTGGIEAIYELIKGLPVDMPGIVIAQHIPGTFSASFAKRLDAQFPQRIEEAYDNAPVTPGRIYIAAGGRHLRIARSGARFVCRLGDDDPVNRHKPSVEVLFDSLREVAGRNQVAVMLTGMGKDGSEAMLRMHQAGIHTIVQDEASSVVWGMPGEVVRLGGASEVRPLNTIAAALIKWTQREVGV